MGTFVFFLTSIRWPRLGVAEIPDTTADIAVEVLEHSELLDAGAVEVFEAGAEIAEVVIKAGLTTSQVGGRDSSDDGMTRP